MYSIIRYLYEITSLMRDVTGHLTETDEVSRLFHLPYDALHTSVSNLTNQINRISVLLHKQPDPTQYTYTCVSLDSIVVYT